MRKWCLLASSFIFDRIIIQDRHKSSDEFNFGPLVSMAHLYVFWNEIWPWHIGLRWAIVALWATCLMNVFIALKESHFWFLFRIYIWATSWENLFLPYVNNRSADQVAHPRSLISAFVIRCLDSIVHLVSIFEISSLYIASVAGQAGLSLPWSQTHDDRFSHDETHTREAFYLISSSF